MRISNASLQVAVDPNIQDLLKAVCRNNARTLCASPAALTDSSTGVAGSALAPVLTQDVKVAASGANLAPRAAFNTAIGVVNNAIAVLATFYNTNVFAKIGTPLLSGFTGTVVTPGTIPAMTKVLTATDGSSDAAMLRSEANAAIVRARNNLSTLVKAYNIAATALGAATLNDLTGGSSDAALVINAAVTAASTVLTASVAAGDQATDAAVDAALTALANNVAFLAAKTTNPLLHADVISAVVPVILVP